LVALHNLNISPTDKRVVSEHKDFDPALFNKADEERVSILRDWFAAYPNHDAILQKIGFDGMRRLVENDNDSMKKGEKYILSAMLSGSWTAFESLVGDLWVVALNKGSRKFARNIYTKTAGNMTPDNDGKKSDHKMVHITAIEDFDFDLREKMGSLLRDNGKVDFQSLKNTATAYEEAFGQSAGALFDKKNKDQANILVLSAIRNSIEHRAGRVDLNFQRRVRGCTASTYCSLEKIPLNELLPIDGEMVKELCTSVTKSATDIMKFVDAKMKLT